MFCIISFILFFIFVNSSKDFYITLFAGVLTRGGWRSEEVCDTEGDDRTSIVNIWYRNDFITMSWRLNVSFKRQLKYKLWNAVVVSTL